MSRRLTVSGLLIAVVGFLMGASAWGDETENYQRLQSMPRERRAVLAENLDRFDKLDRAEQASIQKLDARLASMDPVDQARYRAVLRRYHQFVEGLTADQKQRLRDAPDPEARLALARQFRQNGPQGRDPRAMLSGLRAGEIGLLGPFEVAHLMKVWNKLTPARKNEIEKQGERSRTFDAIWNEARSSGVRFDPFPPDDEAAYSARLEADPDLKPLLSVTGRGPELPIRKAISLPKRPELLWRRSEHQMAEFLYFQEHRPHPVLQKNLERFASASPAWLRTMIDPLTADNARDYLTILYRLLYPFPEEMPVLKVSAKPAVSPVGPRTAPGKATNAGPF
ncbi:hypothetical protein P12x_003317 [Tundrisphaera lichenicola]|uniref:hypothetical protein n=1 Tax=Tundrisphaera lichenicola TaxID=2029860 RepID=UPI003EB8E9EC